MCSRFFAYSNLLNFVTKREKKIFQFCVARTFILKLFENKKDESKPIESKSLIISFLCFVLCVNLSIEKIYKRENPREFGSNLKNKFCDVQLTSEKIETKKKRIQNSACRK